MSDALIDAPEPHEARVQRIVDEFRAQFGHPPEGISEAPGRVNLIGEHVDYNDGLVLPLAIDRSVLCAWRRRDDDGVWAYSADYDEHSRWKIGNVTHAADSAWANYPRAVAWALGDAGHAPGGLEIALTGDVPQGAGLSSSAAVEVAVAGAFRAAFGLPIDDVALALLCQRAENAFVGVQSGILDQFASALSQRDAAFVLDCRTRWHGYVPLHLREAGLTIVIANSAVRRELITSAYNERRRECEEAVSLLRERLARPDLASLRDVTADEVARVAGETPPTVMRRARHVVSEIARVAAAADALDADDFETLGRLMVESHLSLRNDYDVSSEQLDLLVGLATAQPYVLGARLTGAGFGGCTVNIVRADALDAFARDVITPYRQRTGLPAVMYVTEAAQGLRDLTPGPAP